MAQELSDKLHTERLVYITTYDSQGKPGTVPVWFLYHQGVVYITTSPTSRKARKIAQNPGVTLRLGERRGPRLEGEARIVGERETLLNVARLFFAKYDPRGQRWGSPEGLAQQWMEGQVRVLVEVSLKG